MITRHLRFLSFLLLVSLTTASSRSCNDPSCFVKKLFDFSYPAEDVYPIFLSGNKAQTNNFIKAYGDFNSDLRADFVSLNANSNISIFIFSTSSNLYELTYSYAPFEGCNPINFFLYDANNDGNLDITVWGSNANGNCMYPLIQNQTSGGFEEGVVDTFNLTSITTQPSLFQLNLSGVGKTSCLLFFNSDAAVNQRQVIYYQNKAYQNITWSSLFTSPTKDYSTIPFSDQHWNTFVDLTNDCYPEFVITNSNNQIQFWVFNSSSNQFVFSSTQQPVASLQAMSIVDVNYDGGLDLVVAESTGILVFLGTQPLSIDSTFCVSQSYNFGFQWGSPITFNVDANTTLPSQNLQFADLNIDGFPELMVLVNVGGAANSAIVYENKFSDGGSFSVFDTYSSKVSANVLQNNVTKVESISFFDILDNGIVDILVNVDTASGMLSLSLYNNYLYQNFFYIKAYGTNGKGTSNGAQLSGASFYWLNSVGNAQKVSICTQLTISSYNALPMPYVLTGLGRANNYVEMFTIGRLGQQDSWSPIIPNSQLAIFAGNDPSSSWGIKIFIMPADSLVYVIIVCIVILAILGLVLVGIKIHRKRNEEPLPLLTDI